MKRALFNSNKNSDRPVKKTGTEKMLYNFKTTILKKKEKLVDEISNESTLVTEK